METYYCLNEETQEITFGMTCAGKEKYKEYYTNHELVCKEGETEEVSYTLDSKTHKVYHSKTCITNTPNSIEHLLINERVFNLVSMGIFFCFLVAIVYLQKRR